MTHDTRFTIFHVADTHLGFHTYTKVDPVTGLNQREEDVKKVFREFIDIVVKERPQLVIHAGDFFDNVRPTNRVIAYAMEQLKRATDIGIKFIIIAGNHETPTRREIGSVFKIIQFLPNVHLFYEPKLEYVTFPEWSLRVACIPHCPATSSKTSRELWEHEIQKIHYDDKYIWNFAVFHGLVEGFTNYSPEFNEMMINSAFFPENFDYYALGHYHAYTKVPGRNNIYYAGSTEYFSFGESNSKKGFIALELENKRDRDKQEKQMKITFRELHPREMIDIGVLDYKLLGAKFSDTLMKTIGETNMKDKIVRLRLENLPREVYHSLDFKKIRDLTSTALHFQLDKKFIEEPHPFQSSEKIGFETLTEEFDRFIDQQPLTSKINKEELKKRGKEYLKNI